MKKSDCIKAFSTSFLLLFIAGAIVSILITTFYSFDGLHFLVVCFGNGVLSLILGLLNLLYLLPFRNNSIRFLLPGIIGLGLYLFFILWSNDSFEYIYLPVFNIFIGLYWAIRYTKQSDIKNPAKY